MFLLLGRGLIPKERGVIRIKVMAGRIIQHLLLDLFLIPSAEAL